jgi:lysozyme
VRWVFAVVAAIASTTAVAWFAWFPHYRPALRADESYGIDVSAHQGSIDWEVAARDDIRFAYIKATEGGDHVDRRFAENWDAAGRAGLDRGAYHFFTLCRPGRDQATNFVDATEGRRGELPPALDLEFGGNCRGRPSKESLFAELDAFIEEVESISGRAVTIYVLPDFDERYAVTSHYERERWVRRIPLRPGGEWDVWQFTGFGHVDGVDGKVDINVRRSRT